MHIDYHVALDGHYYSVPYTLIKRQLDVRFTQNTVECFYRGQRVASHRRASLNGRHTTVEAYMQQPHRHAVVVHIEGASYRLRRHADLIPEHICANAPISPPLPPKKRGRSRPAKH